MPHDAVLLPDHRAVYVEVPKAACSSIKLALGKMLGVDLASAGGNPHKAHFPKPPDPSAAATAYSGLYSFTFVRNPWDRLVSCYKDKILGEASDFTAFHPDRGVAYCLARFEGFEAGMSFDRFVQVVAEITDSEADPHFRAQHTFVSGQRGDVVLDFVGRFESLTNDFERVCRKLAIEPIQLPHVQSTSLGRGYQTFYTRKTWESVLRRFGEDVRLFGYDSGADFPGA